MFYPDHTIRFKSNNLCDKLLGLVLLFMQKNLKLYMVYKRPCSHSAGEIWKCSLISPVTNCRPTVHTNSSWKLNFSNWRNLKMRLFVCVLMENILKTVLCIYIFGGVTIIMSLPWLRFHQTQIQDDWLLSLL